MIISIETSLNLTPNILPSVSDMTVSLIRNWR